MAQLSCSSITPRTLSLFIALGLFVPLLAGCGGSRSIERRMDDYRPAAELIHEWDSTLTATIAGERNRTPCTISRVYAYCNIAAYEAARPGFSERFRSMAGQLNELLPVPEPTAGVEYDWSIAAVTAFNTTAHVLLYEYFYTDSLYMRQMEHFKATVAPDVLERSVAYGTQVGKHILGWMKGDKFATRIQAEGKYVIPVGIGLWEPTPPNFSEPVDPYWYRLRPMVLDSSTQFCTHKPFLFSTDKNSDFYKQAYEVYQTGRTLTDSGKLIARFWDCNPIHTTYSGHLVYNTRQISPGGHWLTINEIVNRQKGTSMMEALESYALVSIALYDGFLACWAEKYKVNGIRPVTYIQRYIDSTWEPYIETPPFPEYASGHSTISAASAVILTHLFGDVAFDDDTETYLGLPVRRFKSFKAAAQEAATSRFYGGIHYTNSNQVGVENGTAVAEHTWRRVKTRQ